MNKIIVQGDQMHFYSRPNPIPSGQVQFSVVEFKFSEEWQGFWYKIAQFKQGDTIINVSLQNDACSPPSELNPGCCKLRVKGYNGEEEIATANELIIPVVRGFENGGIPPVPPTPDLYQQLIEQFQRMIPSPEIDIPYDRLSEGVQHSLDLADSALQEHQSLAGYAKTEDLATVATSGSYNDLEDKPTIPTITESPYISLARLGAYAFELSFGELPEFVGGDGGFVGGCSSYVQDGKLFRNLDWDYSELASFHVICSGFEGMAFTPGLTDTELPDALLGQLPYRLVDGCNDAGIRVSTHVLFNDWDWVGSGSTPLYKLPYIILSSIKTLEDFETQLSDVLGDLYATPTLTEADYLLHFLVTDGTTTYCIAPPEDESGSYVVIDITANAKLSNFRWVPDATVDRADLQDRPTGVERWNMMPCELSELRFTKAYEAPDRLSEFIGLRGTDKDSSDEELLAIYEDARELYLDRQRDGSTWQTMHSVVYSGNGPEVLNVQENFAKNYIAQGGSTGGGGGGGDNNAVLTLTNTTGWLYKTLAQNSDCVLSATWSSIEGSFPTGPGVLTIKVGGAVKYTGGVGQGQISVNIAEYLSAGSNSVRLTISDVYENTKTISFTVQVVALVLTSNFDSLAVYSSAIPFIYTPVGAVSKTVHFLLDGQELGTETVTESGRQQTYIIPAQEHGAHSLMCYFEATIDGETVSSNVLYYDIICAEDGNTEPIIASTFRSTVAEQYIGFTIPYLVYDPLSLTASVELYADGELLRTISVDRTVQQWTYQPQETGELELEIRCGDTSRVFLLNVSASSIDVEATTRDLSLYLTAYGRSNGEVNPSAWGYNGIAATLTGFQFVADGWVNDADGNDILRVQGDARVSIPDNLFENDFRTTGKTIEVEFSTSNVMDYDAPIISCWSGNRGILVTPQKVVFASEQASLEVSYKEEEHVRVTFVVEKRTESRLVYLYLNGIMSGVIQYDTNDDFTQLAPVGISIGSELCTTDIYCIRVYENDLTRIQILNNWIADTQNGSEKIARYQRNNIYDAYGVIDIDKLPTSLPVMIWEIPVLPTYKGDKRNTTGVSYDDQENVEQSFVAGVSQMNVQGTSSQYYYRKNFKLKFSTGLTVNGTEQTKYALRPGAIPEKEFTLKADVASSEGANNVELVRLYNDASKAYGILTPPQQEDSRKRVGIDGFPMVCFHNNGSDTYFYGKFNFNNDKGNEDTFGFSEGDESWEVKNNTSSRVLFKSADFTGEDWLNDFEARYPDTDPVYVDNTKLAAMCAWVVSTDRDAVSTDAEKEARLAKFKDELEDHFDVDSCLFYYLFTELFLMVDSRAKNAFPTYWAATGKWFWLPYDMDTALGINNEGALVFGYSLEDTDTVDGALVYNGQTSTFWRNLRDAFHDELAAMYNTLRGQPYLSYDYVEGQFDEHQAKWPEAIFNEDSYSKCLEPLILNGDATYLEMLQGSKAMQRKWWMYNRFRYIDSKYNAGDAKSDYIQLRGYSKDSITITPYADIYASVLYGSYLVQARALRGSSYTLLDPLDSVNDTEILVFSASQLKSIGDISGLKVGLCDLSRATKLQSIKLGSDADGYTNPNLRTLTFGNNTLLKTIDCRNCINLGTGVTAAPDISGCVGVEEVYFDGTAITGITLPNGGVLTTLHLPETIANLTVQNLTKLTDFDIAGIDNITTLRVENTPALDDITPRIILSMPDNSRVRATGVNWTSDGMALLRKLEAMRGLDENGNNLPNAVVEGVVDVGMVLPEDMNDVERFRAMYPYLTINARSLVIVPWATGTDQQIADMAKAARDGNIDLHDYWAVGDVRTVNVSAIAANASLGMDAQAEQDTEWVLMDSDCEAFTITATGEKPSFIVGMKNCLLTKEFIDSRNSNIDGWNSTGIRQWLNNDFYRSLPNSFKNIVKPFTWQRSIGSKSTMLLSINDTIALPPCEASSRDAGANLAPTELALISSRWEYYTTSANRIKHLGSSENAVEWWTSSVRYESGYNQWIVVKTTGTSLSGANNRNIKFGISPFAVI